LEIQPELCVGWYRTSATPEDGAPRRFSEMGGRSSKFWNKCFRHRAGPTPSLAFSPVEVMNATEITPRHRRAILLAIEKVIPKTVQQNKPLMDPRYPDSVPDIDQHIDDLIQLVRTAAREQSSSAEQIRVGICDRCPHQFPSRYCPLHEGDRCIPRRFAEQIAGAVSSALASHT
jgi:hypothetical protein